MLTSQLIFVSSRRMRVQLMLMLASGILSCQLEDFGSDVLHRGGQVRFSLQPPAPELNILGPPCLLLLFSSFQKTTTHQVVTLVAQNNCSLAA